jgi:hypothetical protein
MKNAGRFLLVFLLIWVISGIGYAAGKDAVVYITNTGKKYHTEKCSSAGNSKIETTLGKAVVKGYEPCARCKPPVLD